MSDVIDEVRARAAAWGPRIGGGITNANRAAADRAIMLAAFDVALARADKAEAALAEALNNAFPAATERAEKAERRLAAEKARADKAEAALAEVEAQRDAAVARNIILHQQKTEEDEHARVNRIPVADFAVRVLGVLSANGVDETTIDQVRALDGWDGTEGGFIPGLETTTYVLRERLDAASRRGDAAIGAVQEMHGDLARVKAENDALRDFAESPPIWWSVADGGALIHAELDGASVIAKFADNSMRLVRADGEVLADLIVRARNEDEKPQAAIEEIGAALLWSHRRSLRLAAIAAAKGGATSTFAGHQMCNMTGCGGNVEMHWRGRGFKVGKCDRCSCAVQCSTTEDGPIKDGGAA